MASKEYHLLSSGEVGDRVELRLKRVQLFVDYLKHESEIERETFSLSPNEVRYAEEIKKRFLIEQKKVRASADRYITKRDPSRMVSTHEYFPEE